MARIISELSPKVFDVKLPAVFNFERARSLGQDLGEEITAVLIVNVALRGPDSET
jgi:hypothetical protein